MIISDAPEVTTLDYENDSLTITCIADGHPPPSFKIYFNEDVVVNKKTYRIPKRNSTYFGNYTCEAFNLFGKKRSPPQLLPNLSK